MKRTRPLCLTHDLVDLVERVLDGGVLVEEREDADERPASAPGEHPWLPIPLGDIHVLTLHAGHSVHPAKEEPSKPARRHR